MANESKKFERIFQKFDDQSERLVRVEQAEEFEKQEIAELRADVKALQATVNQYIGKSVVMAAIFGVIGTIVSGVVVWIISLVKGSST